MTPSSPGFWSNNIADRTDVQLGFVQNIFGADFAQAVRFSTGILGYQEYQQIALRLICHFLVNQIPPDGLKSLYENLMEDIQFYKLPPTSEPFALMESGTVPAKLAGVYERPRFQITEE